MTGARDRYQGFSFANFAGHLEYDRRVLADFSWGAWFWNPDKAMGIPRFGEVLNRPLYPVHLALVAVLPTLTAWHWITLTHLLLKLIGLILVGVELRWPPWLIVVAASGAMFTHGSLTQFGDVTTLAAAAWLPLQIWLSLKVVGRSRWCAWDVAWVACAALRFLGSHPNRLLYYELLLVFVIVTFGRRQWRVELGRLALRYALALLIAAPLLLPVFAHFSESARTHFLEFEDWPFRRAYNWRNDWLRLSDLTDWVLVPSGLWLALLLALVVARGSAGPLSWALGAYLLFAVLHAVRYAPFWFLLAALPGVRMPQKAFEPLTWLATLALADVAARYMAESRRWPVKAGMVALVLGGFSCAVWQTPLDPSRAYVFPPWTRPLPMSLASKIKSEPRAQVLLATGGDRTLDLQEPILNSNHNLFLGVPSARFLGDVPMLPFMRAVYRVPGLLLMQRAPTPLSEWEPLLDLYAELGIRWVIWDGAGDPVHPRLKAAGEEYGFRLYEITDSRPLVYATRRMRVATRPRVAADVAGLVYTLPSAGPFCYECPERMASDTAPAQVRWVWRPGDISVTVDTFGGDFVVLGETFSRGWRASLDGADTRIYQVNEMFQAVWVPPGRHEVVWRYREPSFFFGLGLSGVGFAVLAGLFRWQRGRKSP